MKGFKNTRVQVKELKKRKDPIQKMDTQLTLKKTDNTTADGGVTTDQTDAVNAPSTPQM